MSLRKKQSFRPKKNNISSLFQQDLQVKKGEGDIVKINIDELEDLVKYLRKHSDTEIRNLSGELQIKFNRLVSQVTILNNTSSYQTLCQIIKKHFNNIDKYKPGTLASYFNGCLVKTSFSNDRPGCSPICAGSIPSDEHQSRCENTVILAVFEDDKYTFKQFADGTSEKGRKTAYIFIDSSNLSSFHGFSELEKEHLKSWGIENVMLYSYRDNGTEYVELTGKTELSQCKSRVSTVSRIRRNDTDFAIWWVLLIVILIIIILVVMKWRRYR